MSHEVKIKQVTSFLVEVDGKVVPGDWRMESDWNGMIELKCNAPIQSIIIHKPSTSHLNAYDNLHPLFGGNVEAWKKGVPSVKVCVVKHSCVNELRDVK